jgi:hypothetical protein
VSTNASFRKRRPAIATIDGLKVATCEVRPDAARTPLSCQLLDRTVRASSAHLVADTDDIRVNAVTQMGATPDETEYGTFTASGEKVGDALEDRLASDRPQVPVLGDTWVSAALDGEQVVVGRKDGGLTLQIGSKPEETLVHSHDTDGPALGTPLVFIGQHAAVIVFHAEGSISAMRVTSDGAETVRPDR